MTSIEITIGGHKFMIRAEESEVHLAEVAELVRRKVETMRKADPAMSLQKAAMLAAFDFASESINGRKKALEYRSAVLAKAGQVIERIEAELAAPPPVLSQIANEKRAKRLYWRSLIPTDTREISNFSARICQVIQNDPVFSRFRKVAIYAPRVHEVDLMPLWRANRTRCLFPRVDSDLKTLNFFEVASEDDLVPGYHGLFEPDPARASPIELTEADLVLVPGLAFDFWGSRLGSGAGFYDRFLASLPTTPTKWGVTFSAQISKERLAQEESDVRMDAICSELGVSAVYNRAARTP